MVLLPRRYIACHAAMRSVCAQPLCRRSKEAAMLLLPRRRVACHALSLRTLS